MKKIILTLVAIMMVSMTSVSMASNKGRHHNGNRTEVIVRYDNGRDRDYRHEDYRDGDRYMRPDNRRYDNYRDNRDYENRYRENRYHDRRHHHNSDAKVAGLALGAAALILLTTSH